MRAEHRHGTFSDPNAARVHILSRSERQEHGWTDLERRVLHQVFAVADLVDALSLLIDSSPNWERYLDTLDTYCSILERGRELLWDVRAGSPDAKHALVRRAEELEALHRAAVEMGRRGGLKGGRARALSLTAEQRSEQSRKAAQARWGNRA